KKPAVFEKYFAFASFTFFSAACGFTISRPCSGVNATLDAVPETCFFTVVLPPHCCCFWRFFCRVLEIRTLVFSSIWGSLILPVPALPIIQACFLNSVVAYRSFIFLTRFPPLFFRPGSMGLGSGLINLTGGGSCNLS
ncbi:GSCOCG00009981001-RA-CDS, partial [Cotesia congregata]